MSEIARHSLIDILPKENLVTYEWNGQRRILMLLGGLRGAYVKRVDLSSKLLLHEHLKTA